MDELQQIIHSFSKEEQKEFEKFIQRNRFRSNRKDLQLFKLFAGNNVLGKQAILQHLYGQNINKNPYHTLRKRLIKELNDFIYLKRGDNDDSLGAEVNKIITLVHHLFDHKLDKLAWKQLLKVEKMAIDAEFNQQLVLIYDLQIQHYSQLYLNSSIQEIVSKRIDTNILFNEDETLKIIGSLVKQELEKVKMKGEDLDLQIIANDLFRQFNIEDSILKRPKLLYNFLLLTRTIVLAKKDFYSFDGFLINGYNRLKRSGYFEKKKSEEINILYMLSHTLYRNKKFDIAIDYLDIMRSKLFQVNKGIFNQYYSKYYLLLAACENFKGNLTDSIALLKDLISSGKASAIDILNAQLNLSVYLFEDKKYKAANQVLINIGHTDNWLEKIMGIEWRFKKNIIEVFFQYELGNLDIAFDRILSMERIHRDLFKSKKYKKVSIFLNLIKLIINNPEVANSTEFYEKVESSFEWVDVEQEDLQAMSYYAWLKSKMMKQDFYNVLLELIARTR